MKKIIIAIDGHSSTGKSTIAKQLAHELSYIFIDSGAMYRAVTLYAMQQKIITKTLNKKELIKNLHKINLEFKYHKEKGFSEMFLNGVNVEKEIRTMEVSNWVSKVAEISEVRKKLVEQQQKIGKNKGIVMDGRDIGTVVFPQAELKFFITASAEKRADRRYKELLKKGHNVFYEAVYKNVKLRDNIDSTRKDSPLVKAKDAVLIDNSDMTLEEQFKKIITIVASKLS